MALTNWPQPEQTSCLFPRLRRTHNRSRLAGSSISARYTLYPGQTSTRVQSFSLMESSVTKLTESQNPRKTTLFPDSRKEPFKEIRRSSAEAGHY
jgi:hypothetical protein